MPHSAAQRNPILQSLAAVVNVPREIWKRLFNLTRGVKDISPATAQAYIQRKGALVLDVREQKEYDAGHVPDSVLIPLASLETRIDELAAHRQRPIVVICHGGKRSASACWQLGKRGFAQTYNIAGGILAWKRANLPVEQ